MFNRPLQPQPYNPMGLGPWQSPDVGGGSGGSPGLGALGHHGQMGGYNTYLQGLGWNGAPGTRFDFAQGLRDQGQHPFMDYMHSLHPNGYDGSGINPGGSFPGPRPGGLSGNDTGVNIYHPMNPGSYQPQGIAPTGLMSLARRRPLPVAR
jgi:hypothetical protein